MRPFMAWLEDVPVAAVSLDRFVPLVGQARIAHAKEVAARVRGALGPGVLWHVSSTRVGGGVAEMLTSLLAYARGEGIDARWVVLRGPREFFDLTKRIHHALHGSRSEGGLPTETGRPLYEATTGPNAAELAGRASPSDIVVLHDPQTAGMAPMLLARGLTVVWRCHIGHDVRSPEVDAGWAFLAPYLGRVHATIFSRAAYVPRELPSERAHVIQPSIDAFSPKNADIDPDTVRAILTHVGLLAGPAPPGAEPSFRRLDGSPARVERVVDLVRAGPPTPPEAPMIVQVSRWDTLKDMRGVLSAFARLIDGGRASDASLVLAGPNVHGVADDPEGPEVFRAVLDTWYAMSAPARARVQLAMIPTADPAENAAVVNALQRHATIVAQKSLHEGFGLTVTEAMWKARAVVASRVGGIQDQIVHGESGILLDDPRDLSAFGDAIATLLASPVERSRIGDAARERVRDRFLGVRHLLDYAGMLLALLEGRDATAVAAPRLPPADQPPGSHP